jgi:L-histidine N-alpha-methyltransferase
MSDRATNGTIARDASVTVDVHLRNGALASLADDVRAGLAERPRTLHPKYFYDARGSELFEQITELPEYYPTRTEQAILDAHGAEIVDSFQPQELIELGPGSARKTHALLDPMVDAGLAQRYVPFDVSESAVLDCADRLSQRYEGLEVHGVVGDFESHLDRVPVNGGRRLFAFLGGTIGNLDAGQRQVILRSLRAELRPDDRLLIGTDLVKDRERLEAAYNDSAGVTAAFNRNVLQVINLNLDANFEPDRFDHVAIYDETEQRIEMRLRAAVPQSVRIDALDMNLEFDRDEQIRTEISCKFTRSRLAREYALANLELLGWYSDPEDLFALSLTGPRVSG